jgi:hypothetical protein
MGYLNPDKYKLKLGQRAGFVNKEVFVEELKGQS